MAKKQIRSSGAEAQQSIADAGHIWLVHSPCDCGETWCYGETDIKAFLSEQTARQEADQRSKRYGGHSDPSRHIKRVPISTKTTGW